MAVDSGTGMVQQHPAVGDQSANNVEIISESVKEPQMLVDEAQNHVRLLRHEKGLDTGSTDLGANASDLTAALDVLSDQLYTQPTHFLLEFIQNADDNSYAPDVIPTISFSSSPGTLLIQCNETGFAPKNVEAICRIAHSTKKDRSKGFIGEKGIGFKSVFKIAKTVHIASNAYQFKFNRDGPLGMIAPIWSPFPRTIIAEHTQFLLELAVLKKEESEKQLRYQLCRLDGTLLLFLRKLKRISVAVDDGSQAVKGKFTKDLCREDGEAHAGEMVRIYGDRKRIRRLEEDTEYTVVRHTAVEMPFEAKRRGMETSEVVIALPFQNNRPTFFTRHAYAFLPIRDSKYRFLLHADFILIANREDLEHSNDWNRHLLWALAQCFAKVVERFNSPGAEQVRYTWPGFLHDLPKEDVEQNGFSPLGRRIINVLRMRKIFETLEGDLVEPSNAIFVPAAFRDGDGNFVLARCESQKRVINNEYAQHDQGFELLQALEVEIMDSRSFLQILKKFITDRLDEYTASSSEWHSQIAHILLKTATPPELRGCHFETADAKAGLEHLPEGILDLKIVDSDAAADPARRALLKKLDVKDLDRFEVCRLLLDFHKAPVAPSHLSLEALIGHAVYLFEVSRSGRSIPKLDLFWVYDCNGNLRRSHLVYHDVPEPNQPRIGQFLPQEQWGSLILQPGYTLQHTGKTRENWIKWLGSYLSIRAALQVVSDDNKFSPEFNYILTNVPSPQVLDLLMVSYHKDPRPLSSTTVKQMLGAIEVICEDGGKCSLNKTCLPTPELKSHAVAGIPFVLLNNHASHKWKSLADFGVLVRPDLKFYMRCLTLTAGKAVSRYQIVQLYGRIEAALHEDPNRVRAYFKDNLTIYVPSGKVWASSAQCCWEPTPGVSGELPLATYYPELHSFFFDHLQVRSATIEKVAKQLREMSLQGQTGNLELRKALIISLSEFVRKSPQDFGKVKDSLRDVPLMPIAGKHGLPSTVILSLNKTSWYFCDRHEYQEAFKDLDAVNFADFAVEQYFRLEPLDRVLKDAYGMSSDHALSYHVGEVAAIGSQAALDFDLTTFMRNKVKFLRRVMKACRCHDLNHKFDQLHHLKVFYAPQMILELSLNRGALAVPLCRRPATPYAQFKVSKDQVSFYVHDKKLTSELRTSLSDQVGLFCQHDDHRMKSYIERIFNQDNQEKLYDYLAHHNVRGHEDEEHTPLPVQPQTIVPVDSTATAMVPSSTDEPIRRETSVPNAEAVGSSAHALVHSCSS